jgi:hypothetical protein
MSREYYTVIYRVDGDETAHKAWWQETIVPLFMTDSEPVSVLVITMADETARLDCIAHIIESRAPAQETVEAIQAMLVHPDPGAWLRQNGPPPDVLLVQDGQPSDG